MTIPGFKSSGSGTTSLLIFKIDRQWDSDPSNLADTFERLSPGLAV